MTRVRGRSPAAHDLRRSEVIRVATELATSGGPDAVQMREVARLADVSLATLYKIARSKLALLYLVMVEQVRQLDVYSAVHPTGGTTRGDRVARTLLRAFRAIRTQPKLGQAVFSVFTGGGDFLDQLIADGVSVGDEHRSMHEILRRAIAEDGSIVDAWDAAMIDVCVQTWNSTVEMWLGGSRTTQECRELIDFVAHLLDNRPAGALGPIPTSWADRTG